VDAPHVYNLEDLVGLTDAEVLKLLDIDWPWPLSTVQSWFESLWNNILQWITDAKQWIIDHVTPVIHTVWDWLEAAKQWIVDHVVAAASDAWSWMKSVGDTLWTNIQGIWAWLGHVFQDGFNFVINTVSPYFDWLWKWLQTAFGNLWGDINSFLQNLWNGLQDLGQTVRDKVDSINSWFSNEFIDPFIDWLLKFPQNFVGAIETLINSLGTRLENWFTHRSPGFPGILEAWLDIVRDWISRNITGVDWRTGNAIDQSRAIWSLIGLGLAGAFSGVLNGIGKLGPMFESIFGRFGGWLWSIGSRIGPWFGKTFSNLWIWIGLYVEQFGPTVAKAIMPRLVPFIGSGAIIAMESTGALQDLVGRFITPAITGIFAQFEAMGPVAPTGAADMSAGITKLATFTISGLAAMTIGGELLSPIKQLGLGNISAIIYDLINYRTLTAAFMGVLAAIYIKTPLTYYYNRIARPNIPDERGLSELASDYQLTKDEFITYMSYHGYADSWSEKLYEASFRPMTPYMLRSLAEAGLLDMDFLDSELRHAGYREQAIPFIKQMMSNLAGASLAAVSTSTAMTRFQEGFDDEAALRQNLQALGIADKMLDRYVFAAELKYMYDYQVDLKTFYIDAYHRRDIEEPELRQDLVYAGLNSDRIDLVVQAQQLKRLKAAAAAAPPELKIQEETIRTRRTKNLITADQEVSQLVSLGLEMPYALAIADQDTVKLTTAVSTATPTPIPPYETEAGKTEVDTIRRLTRSKQMDSTAEFNALLSLGMSQELSQAIADNDVVRMSKSAGGP
jgi:hypothetical protein